MSKILKVVLKLVCITLIVIGAGIAHNLFFGYGVQIIKDTIFRGTVYSALVMGLMGIFGLVKSE